MNILTFIIFNEFRRFGITAAEFNKKPIAERMAYTNTLRFMVKEEILKSSSIDPDHLKAILRTVDKRVDRICFE